MKIKTTVKDILWNHIGIALAMGANFILLPFMMLYLDSDYLGLWYVFVSIGNVVNILDFGFGPTIIRNLAYVWSGATELRKEDAVTSNSDRVDSELFCKTLYTCRSIYFVIATIALIMELTLGTAYIVYVSKELDLFTVLVSWIIYSIAVFLNLYFGYFYGALCGVGDVADANKARVIAKSVQIVVTTVLLVCKSGLIGASVGYILYGFLYRLLLKNYFFHYENIRQMANEVKYKFTISETKKMFLILWHNAWRDGLVSLSNFFANQASVLLCSAYMSLSETGIYSISVQIVTALSSIAYAMYNSRQPAMQSAYFSGSSDDLKKSMAVSVFTFFVIYIVGFIGIIFVGLPLLHIIRPDTVFSIPVLFVLAVYEMLYRFHNCCASFISNTNRVPYMPAFLVSSVLGIAISIGLMEIFALGIWGLIIGPMVAQLIYNNWKWPMVVCKNILNTNLIDLLCEGAEVCFDYIRNFF